MNHRLDRFLFSPAAWLAPVLFWTVLVLASLGWNLYDARRELDTLLRGQGEDIFRIIEATRLWNAKHGGVYGKRSPDSPSNPYLQAEDKDITTPSGKPLTLLNPAYMTRQLAAVIEAEVGVRIHLTSLKPINPNNRALDWEAAGLREFEQGGRYYYELDEERGHSQVRYIAPLITKAPCLQCHATQGYKLGDIRGGISVSFSAQRPLQEYNRSRVNLLFAHGASWLALVAMSLLTLVALRRRTRDLMNLANERQDAEAYLRMLVNASPEAMFGVDGSGTCTFANKAAQALLGYESEAAMRGRNVVVVALGCDCDKTGQPRCAILEAISQGKRIHRQLADFVRLNGSHFKAEYSAYPIGADRRIVGGVVTFADVSDRLKSQQQLWHQASHDELTGLANGMLLEDRFAAALAQAKRHQGHFGILVIDLLEFDSHFGRFGHDVADAILKVVVMRIRECIRDTDTLARVGQTRFMLMAPLPVSRADLGTVADRMTAALARSYRVGSEWLDVPTRIGMAMYPDDGDSLEQLTAHALAPV